ncbi:hypothetical protein E2C01_029602 [Portunus trituberculatus]|uniref:Uncharacterized protein n=1 Tax=Portunus trituberculatus TaxID=210409 RepID=A0A5B7EV13_PORTR|nr:hypothetical protein [Portunus trituberculatus]
MEMSLFLPLIIPRNYGRHHTPCYNYTAHSRPAFIPSSPTLLSPRPSARFTTTSTTTTDYLHGSLLPLHRPHVHFITVTLRSYTEAWQQSPITITVPAGPLSLLLSPPSLPLPSQLLPHHHYYAFGQHSIPMPASKFRTTIPREKYVDGLVKLMAGTMTRVEFFRAKQTRSRWKSIVTTWRIRHSGKYKNNCPERLKKVMRELSSGEKIEPSDHQEPSYTPQPP